MTDTPPPKTRGWLKPLLFVSLAINLLVVGVVVGSLLSPDGPRKRAEQGPARGFVGEPFLRALPKEERRALFREIVKNRDQIRESRDRLSGRFQAFLAVLRADTFDSEEAKRLLTEQRSVAARRQEFGEAALLERLEAMTAEQRRAYADALDKSLPNLRKKR